MPTGDDTKLPLTSRDVHAERLAHFRELFPEACTEGKTDLKKLAQLLGEAVTDAPERYGLSWSGKSEAIRAIQITSPGTLRPCVEESCPPLPFAGEPEGIATENAKNSEKRVGDEASSGSLCSLRSLRQNDSENLIIEGDNLETLKLLQGGYHGRVKMIYIDPPYNTGGEFIYPDNYKEGLADYLRFSGQVSGEGIRLTTNAETDGRYHSKWLTMIYPRLFLARNLLREDGVIFVSIDDHEVHNLRAVMNEIFGEENFIGQLIWKRRQTVDSRAQTGLSCDHEYVLVYSKWDSRLRGQSIDFSKFSNPDNDPRGEWWSADLTGLATQEQRPNLHYELVNPETEISYACSESGWRYAKQTMASLIQEKRILWPKASTGRPRLKRFKNERESDFTNLSSVLETVYTTQGTRILKELFDGDDVLDFPKPVEFVRSLLEQGLDKDGLILDFFAGSGTTAQAVLELNAQDGGNRKFILVQLPEPTERQDFPTIADITKERVRRVIKKLETESATKNAENTKKSESELPLQASFPLPAKNERGEGQGEGFLRKAASSPQPSPPSDGGEGVGPAVDTVSLRSLRSLRLNQDLGFKVFKLGSSNFKVWDAASAPKDGAALAEQLHLMAHNVEADRPDDALLYELVLKCNLPLTSRVVAGKIGAQTFYDVADGTLAICLERPIAQETLRGLVARKPKGVICLDIAFAGNDQLKANTVLEMKSHGIEFHTA